MDIKFDSLASADLSAFRYASSTDYPNGRYSATVTKVEPQTSDKNGDFCLRFRLTLAVDQAPGMPRLTVTDLISFTNGTAFSAVGANVFCDLVECVGLSRDSVRNTCNQLRDALASADKPGVISSFRSIAEYASALAGSRVAPNIEWKASGDREFANVRGSAACPSYLSASNEVDPGASFTGDDCDMERQPTAKPKRNLKAVRR